MNESTRAAATWEDHNEIKFWSWACIHDGRQILGYRKAQIEKVKETDNFASFDHKRWKAEMHELHSRAQLSQHHFAVSIGQLVKRLDRLGPLFPQVAAAYAATSALKSEGTRLRNMHEHGLSNDQAAAKGTPRGGDIKKTHALDDFLPGDKPSQASATSTLIVGDKVLIGGRWDVSVLLSEAETIHKTILAIPAPPDRYIQAQRAKQSGTASS